MVCVHLCKHYTSLIVIHDGCCTFLHESLIHQKLCKPTSLLRAMASGAMYSASVVDHAMVDCFLHFHKEHVPCGGSLVVYKILWRQKSSLIGITKSFQKSFYFPCTISNSSSKSLSNLEFTSDGVLTDLHFSMLKDLPSVLYLLWLMILVRAFLFLLKFTPRQ